VETAVARLTAREREIAQLAAGGLTSAEIGRRLFLSSRTVDSHLGRVYAKLAVANRTGLAAVMNAGRSVEGTAGGGASVPAQLPAVTLTRSTHANGWTGGSRSTDRGGGSRRRATPCFRHDTPPMKLPFGTEARLAVGR
jgi:DNA-binding CsgD family transcriptional regulator